MSYPDAMREKAVQHYSGQTIGPDKVEGLSAQEVIAQLKLDFPDARTFPKEDTIRRWVNRKPQEAKAPPRLPARSNLERVAKKRCDNQDHGLMNDDRYELHAYKSELVTEWTSRAVGKRGATYLVKTCNFCPYTQRRRRGGVSIG